MSKKVKIETLIQDDKNFNLGTTYGAELMERSLKKFGAGRSVVVDKNGKIIAGNKTVENAIKAGIKEVLVVETSGDKIVAVKRTDVELDSAQGREMALADNATAKENILFDVGAVLDEATSKGFDPAEWGSGIKLDRFTPEFEPVPAPDTPPPTFKCMCPECLHEFSVVK